jgi:hypothetical protein
VSIRDQLDWEARWGKPAAAAAMATILLLAAGTILRQAVALADRPDGEREFLTAINDHSGAFLASSLLQGLSFVALSGVFYYLGRAVLARRPELPSALVWLGVAGPLLLAIAGVLSDLERLDIADQFLASGPETVKRAEDLLDDRSVVAAGVGSAGTLGTAVAFVFMSINAMRVGLLTRFMGVVGAIIGGLYVLPILAGPLVVQIFWLGALAILFLGHWAGGRGPAWTTGEAVEWPSGMARQRELGEPDEDVEAIEPEPEAPNGADTAGRSMSRSSRKRKRR